MKVTVEKESNNIAKMDIEIPAQDAIKEYDKAAKMISEHVNIAGFRKGKAPKNIVEKHVGEERIKQEAMEHMLPKVFQQAITENELEIISQPNIESYNFNVGEDVKITAKVELRPEVTLGEYKGLSVEVEDSKIPEDAFEKSLNGLLQQHATFNVVTDRKTKETDVVVIDFDGSVNGEKIKGGEAKDYSLDIANSNFIPGFAEQLVDKELNSEFDIEVKFPEDYHEEKLKGQPAVFKIKLKEIKEKTLPELTDEFAAKVGPFKNVEELKADIQKYLDTQRENENNKKANDAIFNKVLESVKVDIQESMIEREAGALLEEYKQKLAMQGLSWEQVEQNQTQESKDELMKNLKEEASTRIQNSLVIDAIAKKEKMQVESEDLEKKLAEVERAYQISRAELMKQLSQNPEIINSLSQQIMNEKVGLFLNENNKVEFKA